MAKQSNRGSKSQEPQEPEEKKSLPEKSKPSPTPTGTPGPFDVETVRDLVHLMKEHELAEIELADGGRSLKLKRSGAAVAVQPIYAPAPVHVPQHVSHAPAAPVPRETAAASASKALLEIKSPTPGTFYAQDKPGSKPFAEVGKKITPTSVVCIIEAMKIFNEIQAEVAGTIVEILVGDKQPVEYGQVLFRVDPAI